MVKNKPFRWWHQNSKTSATKVESNKCSKFLSARILIQFLESKFSFSADISPYYYFYNSKTWIWILNTILDYNLKLEF